MVGVILALVVDRQSRDIGLLLTLAVCVMVCLGTVTFLDPVMELLKELRRLGNLDSEAISIALKCAGIGLLSELVGLFCTDAGQSAMAKALELLSAAAILWLSLPLIRELLKLIEGVLS